MAMRGWLGLCLVACSGSSTAAPAPDPPETAVGAAEVAGVPCPADNPTSAAKVELGRLLFWDPVLSGDRDVACASCHHPRFGYGDGRAIAIGTGGAKAARGALTILDAAWNGWVTEGTRPDPTTAPMFWDNRAESLESQALGPLTGENEMRGKHYTEATILPEVVRRLGAIPDYATRFTAVFGAAAIAEESIVRAIADYERTLVTRPSYERYLAGEDDALGTAAKRGLDTFESAGCNKCHSGPMLSDYTLHRFTRGGEAIRTPSLRNVMRTAPYMHDGRAATIGAVLDVYRRVDHNADPKFSGLRTPGRNDLADLEAFFAATSDGDFDASIPSSVPSGLTVGGRTP